MAEEVFDEHGVSNYIKVPIKTLQRWRGEKTGPRFIKAGRLVRYRLKDVEEWLNRQTIETDREVAATGSVVSLRQARRS